MNVLSKKKNKDFSGGLTRIHIHHHDFIHTDTQLHTHIHAHTRIRSHKHSQMLAYRFTDLHTLTYAF